MDVRFVVVELPKEKSCGDGSHSVGCSDADPHAVSTPEFGEDEQEWNEEDELTAHRHENAAFCHTDALEEVTRYYLETYDGREAADKAHAPSSEFR